MSVEDEVDTTAAAGAEEPEPEQLGRELGERITELPAYEAFEAAKAEVEASETVQERMRAFESRRQEYMLARQSGDATQEDLAELKEAQRDLHETPEMRALNEAKADLQAELDAINDAINEPLAVDFAGEAGGCCQD